MKCTFCGHREARERFETCSESCQGRWYYFNCANADLVDRDPSRYRIVGKEYPCDDCGEIFTAGRVNSTRCPVCVADRFNQQIKNRRRVREAALVPKQFQRIRGAGAFERECNRFLAKVYR